MLRTVAFVFLILSSGSFGQEPAFSAYDEVIRGTPVKFRMLPISGGAFEMGSRTTDANREPDEGPAREVIVSSFWMGAHEVTHDEFLIFFNDEQTSRNSAVDAITRPTPQYVDLSWGMGKEGGFPANSMSQRTAIMYCRWLYHKTGHFYRLPTEAEWEYACKAGRNEIAAFANPVIAQEHAWFEANSQKKYHQVAQKKANPWGLYDMLGNVAEWTLDQYEENYFSKLSASARDPWMPPTTTYPKSVRGGAFIHDLTQLRCANRFRSEPAWNRRDPQVPKSKWWLTDGMYVGFRIVRPYRQPSVDEANSFYNTFLQ